MEFIHRLKSLSPEDRLAVLEAEEVGKEEQTYQKPLTDDEITIIKEDLASASIAKTILEEKLKAIKENYKAEIEPHQITITQSLIALRTRSIQKTGHLHKCIDYENRVVYFIDDDGNIINTRMMKPEERQFHISSQIQKAV